MRLTKQTSYAIRILIDCTRAGGRLVKVAEIAGRLDITQQNVFKIVHILSHAGFVEAVRGRNGGVRLAKPPETVRIGDVVRATEVTHVEVEAQNPRAKPGQASVPINQVLDDALDAFITVLDQHTLADMADAMTRSAAASDVPAGKKRVRARPSAVDGRADRRVLR